MKKKWKESDERKERTNTKLVIKFFYIKHQLKIKIQKIK